MAAKRKCSGTIKKMPSLLSSRGANVESNWTLILVSCESGFNRV